MFPGYDEIISVYKDFDKVVCLVRDHSQQLLVSPIYYTGKEAKNFLYYYKNELKKRNTYAAFEVLNKHGVFDGYKADKLGRERGAV